MCGDLSPQRRYYSTHSPRVDLARSVSSTRTINPDSDLGSSICPFLAMSQLYRAVRAPPTCKLPVGEGANLKRGGASDGFLPARGNVATVLDSSVVENKRMLLRKAILEDFVTNAFCDTEGRVRLRMG